MHRSAEVFTSGRYRVHGDRGAEIDHHHCLTSVDLMRRNRIRDPVGAHLTWVVGEDRKTSLDPRLYDDGGESE